jgi:hypothetical protein
MFLPGTVPAVLSGTLGNRETSVQAETKREELEVLRARVRQLEAEVLAEDIQASRQFSRDYPAYHATAGFLLGIVGAMSSLIFNVVGSLLAGKNPLELIRVYLTFPLGERALQLSETTKSVYAVGDGMVIALGCCLYVGTGMLLGIPVALALSTLVPSGGVVPRLIVGGLTALAIWAINFYLILWWLQPMLFGGRWIVDNSLLPWWVAAATHLVFGWTIALLYPQIMPRPIAVPVETKTD